MSTKEEWERLRSEIWDKTKDTQERINQLKKLTLEYHEQMVLYSDIAASYLDVDDVDNAVATYQQIIDLKDSFEHVWDDDLGKAYLFTGTYAKAVETMENSKVMAWGQGLFLAFAYLKNGETQKFRQQFDKWVSEDLEKSFERYHYEKYIKALLTEEETQMIDEIWGKYYEKYSTMAPYQLYCELYKQRYTRRGLRELVDDEDFEIPPKFSRAKFEELSDEFRYLDRWTMFGEPSEEEYERYFELKDLLFADFVL